MGIFDWFSDNKNKDPNILEIGKDIKWTDMVGQVFRVLDFDRNGTVVEENGNVVEIGRAHV